jgi:hypothetical protein
MKTWSSIMIYTIDTANRLMMELETAGEAYFRDMELALQATEFETGDVVEFECPRGEIATEGEVVGVDSEKGQILILDDVGTLWVDPEYCELV